MWLWGYTIHRTEWLYNVHVSIASWEEFVVDNHALMTSVIVTKKDKAFAREDWQDSSAQEGERRGKTLPPLGRRLSEERAKTRQQIPVTIDQNTGLSNRIAQCGEFMNQGSKTKVRNAPLEAVNAIEQRNLSNAYRFSSPLGRISRSRSCPSSKKLAVSKGKCTTARLDSSSL